MITFTKVRYQNFLATGAAPISIELDKHATTLIVGINGAGKSTMSEAICFGLFGKPLRNVNKPKLVNSINSRDCLVELWFHTSSGNYYVKRGIKPNIFEIYRNDILEPIPADIDDYQTHLESILKLNYKSFKQVVVLGSDTYVPFMRLPAAGRRDIIEDLLDIEVFSSMNALAKEDLSETKGKLDTCNKLRTVKGEQIKMAQTFAEHIEQQQREQIAAINRQIIAFEKEVTDLSIETGQLTAIPRQHTEAVSARNRLETVLAQLKAKRAEHIKARQFYEQHENCPECEQIITDAFKVAKFDALDIKATAATDAIAQCEAMIADAHAKVVALEPAMTRITEIAHLLPVAQRRVQELLAERKRVETPKTAPAVDVDKLTGDMDTLNTEHADLSKSKVLLDAATMLLKDNGIKTRVIKHYLPIINKTVNHYLNAMNFPVLFEFNEAFEESFKSRHRDEFVYELFSGGEKQRINLALLLTWREVAKLKNSASTNLLILDEVFDSSLDVAGIEELTKLFTQLERDTNLIVISHRTDQYIDKFEHTLIFDKRKGFSHIK